MRWRKGVQEQQKQSKTSTNKMASSMSNPSTSARIHDQNIDIDTTASASASATPIATASSDFNSTIDIPDLASHLASYDNTGQSLAHEQIRILAMGSALASASASADQHQLQPESMHSADTDDAEPDADTDTDASADADADTNTDHIDASQQHFASRGRGRGRTSSLLSSSLPQLDVHVPSVHPHARPVSVSQTHGTQAQAQAHAQPLSNHSNGSSDKDDTTADHAIQIPDDITNDPNSSIVWSPQNTQSTCEFTHTITNYSSKRESGCKKAEYSNTTIDSFGNRWRLIVYVNGNGRASNHHLSLFLQVADADDLPFGWKKAVSYVLTLEHPNETNMGYAKRNPDKTFKLCPKAIDWGWSQFITSDRIQQDGYIQSDSLTVRASVTVKSSSISIDPEDAELYLKCAVEEGNAEAVEACLAQGASVNCQFKDDLYTPLHTACSSSASDGSLDVLNLLLKRGADGNACNKWRETPLLIAANNGHKAAVEALLKSGADPSMCSEAGWSALTFAAHKGYDQIVALLLDAGAPRNCRVIEDLSTPLHKACAGNKEGHLSAVKQLLDAKADVHALNKWRETPLLTAANHGQAAAVEALLNKGADPCRCTDTGWSPLSIAAYKGHDDVVEMLLEQGAPTEEEDPTLSALLQAATKGLPNTVELLLRHGADHTVTTKKGDTALSILVEQNHIDAAVEMVTEYKASVPRCSRDRKKVQRARLLINLQIKKQQKEEGAYWNDDSDQDDSDEGSNSALHDLDGINKTSMMPSSKKKKNGKKSLNAEDKAKAAADALLLELEQEDAKAQQEEASAISKRNKKKKKKERERHQKLEQERVRKEQEEKVAKELAEQKRVKEEKEKKIKEAKAKKQKELEMKENAERQRKAATRQKEKKRMEDEKREQDKLENERLAQEKRVEELKEKKRLDQEKKAKKSAAKKVAKKEANAPLSQNASLRGWETGNVELSSEASSANASMTGKPAKVTVEDELENMANGVVEFLDFDEMAIRSVSSVSNGTSFSKETSEVSISVEPPKVALYRHDKMADLLRMETSGINAQVVQTVIYKWIVRASSDSRPFLDPLIPSWTDKEALVDFISRQLISEDRKAASNGIATNIEMLKDAGSYLAEIFLSVANDVDEFRNYEFRIGDGSDSALNITANEAGESTIAINIEGQPKMYIPFQTFRMLRTRFVGPEKSFLASVFSVIKRYETFKMILIRSGLDYQLSGATLSVLNRDLGVTYELWTDPLSVFGSNTFSGIFPDVDPLFGGLRPFAEKNNPVEEIICREGGSVAVLPSLDSTTASSFMNRILDILEVGQGKGVPLSFVVFLPMKSFNLTASPVSGNLELLDSRLLQSHRGFIRHFETLRAGQHSFLEDSSGQAQACKNDSIMLILQNDSGSSHFRLSEQAILNVVHSLSLSVPVPSSNDGFVENFSEPVSIPSSPIAPHENIPGFGAGDMSAVRNNGSGKSRFLDFIFNPEDGTNADDEEFANANSMVEGLLKDTAFSDLGISPDALKDATEDIMRW